MECGTYKQGHVPFVVASLPSPTTKVVLVLSVYQFHFVLAFCFTCLTLFPSWEVSHFFLTSLYFLCAYVFTNLFVLSFSLTSLTFCGSFLWFCLINCAIFCFTAILFYSTCAYLEFSNVFSFVIFIYFIFSTSFYQWGCVSSHIPGHLLLKVFQQVEYTLPHS